MPASVKLPTGESLADCEARAVKYVEERVLPRVATGRHAIIAARGRAPNVWGLPSMCLATLSE